MSSDPRAWRILSSEIRIDTPHLRLRADRAQLPNGHVVDGYFVRESRGFCVVFAVTPRDEVVLVRQYKHGAGEVLTELPAGGIDAAETPEECARRELREETGYVAERWRFVRTFVADPTNSNGRFHLFLATGAEQRAETAMEATEEIETFTVPRAELEAMVRDGRITVGSQVAAIFVGLEAWAHMPEH